MRWQDYLWLLLFSGACVLIYLYNKRRPRRSGSSQQRSKNPLTRREQKAWNELQAVGYRLEEVHPAVPVIMSVGEKTSSFNYDGNFIVSKGGESFLVKVMGGESPVMRAALRRELLLDCLFFQTEGVFIYHDEKGLEEVRFAFHGEPGGGRRRLLWKGALLLLIIAGLVFLGYLLKDTIF